MSKKIICLECGLEFTNMVTHLIKSHGLSKNDYLSKYPDAKIVSDEFRQTQRNIVKERYERTDINYREIAGSRTFDFINNNKLQSLLQRDYKSAKVCLKNKLWKPSIILYGSIIEAVLREITNTETFDKALDVSYENKTITEKEYHKIHMVKDLRNFVHLHKELSEGEEINEYWAMTFADICESFIKRFKGKSL